MDSALRGILAESADGKASRGPIWPNLPARCVGLRLVRRRSPIGFGMLALVALLAALALAGCGDGDSPGGGTAATAGPDPASVTPQGAAVYGEVLVRPGGDVERGVLAAARKVVLVEDPAAELRQLLDEASDEDTQFARDIDPWLGDRIGGFMLLPRGGANGDPDWALAFAVRDRDALERTIERFRDKDDQRPAGTYGGVAYDRDVEDRSMYSAMVGDFYVGGSLAGLKAAIDASKGPSLAESDRFQSAIEPLDDDQLAFAYADPTKLVAAIDAADLSDPRLERLAASQRDADPVTLGLTARADEIALELHADVAGTPLADLQDGGLSVGELPGDAWLALATPALGPLIASALDAAGVHDEAAQQVRGALGLDLDRELLEPLGGLAAFARGTGVLDLGGGVMLKMDDAGAARTLLTRLRAIVGAAGIGVVRPSGDGFELLAPRVPQPIVVDALGDRIAAGYARSSTEDLLNPQERFDESPGGEAALATLGEGFTPSLVVLVPPIVQLLESLDAIGIADLSQALPYVRPYRSLAVGTQRDDDRVTVRVVAALR